MPPGYDHPPGTDAPSSQRPKGVVPIGAICLVIAGLGVFAALSSLASAALGIGSEPPANQPGMTPHVAEAQRRMYEEMQEAAMPWASAGVQLLRGLVDGAVIFAAIQLLRGKERGRALLRSPVLPAAMAAQVLGFGWNIFINARTWGVLKRFMENLAPPGSPSGSDFTSIVMASMITGIVIGILFTLFWSGAICGFYSWAIRYLGKKNVREHFEPNLVGVFE